MVEFASAESYWHFRSKVIGKNRYFRDETVDQFLQTVLATSTTRQETILAGGIVYRAQLGNDWELMNKDNPEEGYIPCGYPPERMKPLSGSATEGRANPKGLPYLYVATKEQTAMAEVRPWVGSYVSVAQFKILRDLRIMECTSPEPPLRLSFQIDDNTPPEEPPSDVREAEVWYDIDQAFSRPVSPSDQTADYVPTQVLAEFFRTNGFDGVAYRSSLGEGHNIVLFDVDCADLINCQLFEVKSVEFKFSIADNRYYVSKYYGDTNEKS